MGGHIQPIEIILSGLPDTPAQPGAGAAHLSDDHPLVREAVSVMDALESVTNGMEDPDALERMEAVSCDSPLAPWADLVRALRAFYAGEHDRMKRLLGRIPRSEAPRRIERVLLLLAGEDVPRESLGRVEKDLVRDILGEDRLLTETLAEVEHAPDAGREETFSDSAAFLARELYAADPVSSKRLFLWALAALRKKGLDDGILRAHGNLIYGAAESEKLCGRGAAPEGKNSGIRSRTERAVQLELFGPPAPSGGGVPCAAGVKDMPEPLGSPEELRGLFRVRPKYLGPGIWIRTVRALADAAEKGADNERR